MERERIDPNVYIPMPVSLLGALVDRKPNFMTVSWVTRVNANPPYVGVSAYKTHYTCSGIDQNRTFSLNFPGAELIVETDYCGMVSGRKSEKATLFEVFYGELKTAPMVARSPYTLECRLIETHDLPTNKLYVGEIAAAYIGAEYLTNGKPDFKKMDVMLLTMPDNQYWSLGNILGEAWNIGGKLKRKSAQNKH